MMGGGLTVQSELGKGSVFTVTLPAEVRDPAKTVEAAATKADTEVEPRLGNATTVLVIDDDANARDLMRRALTREGYRVELAANGQQGLQMAAQLKPSVITLDVIMPGMDGWAVLTALKANLELADIPVIMMTILDDKNLAFSLGAADYLTKPVDWEQLNALLAKLGLSCDAPIVLVVDDDPQARELLRRGLEKAGCRVYEAENGQAALAAFALAKPALVLLDLIMPEMDGFEFLRQLRARPEFSPVPVIIITAKELTEEDHRRLNGSVAEVLRKGGYSLDELLAQIRVLIRGHEGVAQRSTQKQKGFHGKDTSS
jgi:DNA-binding response OmpR family regulator